MTIFVFEFCPGFLPNFVRTSLEVGSRKNSKINKLYNFYKKKAKKNGPGKNTLFKEAETILTTNTPWGPKNLIHFKVGGGENY